MKRPRLTRGELDFLLNNQEVLMLLSDYNSTQETMADSLGFSDCVDFHKTRREDFQLLSQEAKGRELLET
jgi:hypothetical protein